MKAKEDLQNLINQINNESELESYLNLIKTLSSKTEGQLMSKLSAEQKTTLELSNEESLNSSNLVDHEAIKSKYL